VHKIIPWGTRDPGKRGFFQGRLINLFGWDNLTWVCKEPLKTPGGKPRVFTPKQKRVGGKGIPTGIIIFETGWGLGGSKKGFGNSTSFGEKGI